MHSGQFVAKSGGRHNHFGVVTAFEYFQVRAAGERGLDADADFARLQRGRRNIFNPDLFLAEQDGRFHTRSLGAWQDEAKQSFQPAAASKHSNRRG